MDKKFKIIISDFIADSLLIEKSIVGNTAEVFALDAYSENELEGKIEDADAIIMYHSLTMTRKTIDRLKQCKLIVRAGVGIDNVDHSYARTRAIPVANIPDYGSEDVADTAIGMMLALTRGITFLNSRLRHWHRCMESYTSAAANPATQPYYRYCWTGQIGTAAALRAKAFGMNVFFYDPYKPDGFDKALGIQRAESLQSLLEQVVVLSLHCPLTKETYHLINEKSITYLPAGSYLINTARGGVVDTSAIPGAIASGHLAGAAFDVLEQEPPVNDALVEAWQNPDHPAYHKVLINPHSAFYSEEGLHEIRVKAAQACLRALNGEQVKNIVN
jgi:D-3-phosphoglycerate dehydrogenase/C-terminal binding protein